MSHGFLPKSVASVSPGFGKPTFLLLRRKALAVDLQKVYST